MSAWNDFNDAEQQQSVDLIPKGTVAKVRMTLKPGGYDDPSQGWGGRLRHAEFRDRLASISPPQFVVHRGRIRQAQDCGPTSACRSPKGPTWATWVALSCAPL
jgi:hypothetical protein